MPHAILVAGANGAGKTTFARHFLPTLYPGAVFLNADEIQREVASYARPISAGREILRRLGVAERQRDDFVVETTLSSTMYARRVEGWQSAGFHVSLHFIELPSEDYAVERVAARVAAGGHFVPEDDVRRRFRRGLMLFDQAYKAIVDEWYHWKSDDGGLRLVQHHER
jgi:predicted ABC-type ATPase